MLLVASLGKRVCGQKRFFAADTIHVGHNMYLYKQLQVKLCSRDFYETTINGKYRLCTSCIVTFYTFLGTPLPMGILLRPDPFPLVCGFWNVLCHNHVVHPDKLSGEFSLL